MTDLSQYSNDQLLGMLNNHPAVQQSSPQPIPDQIGNQLGLAARYGVEGTMAIPNAIGDAANSAINLGTMGVNKLAGTNYPMLGMPSQSTSDALTMAGVPQPQGIQQRMVGDAGRALVGTGSTILGANALSDSVPMMQQLANNAAMQARGALGGSLAAGGTREIGGGSIAQALAGLAGGWGATRQPFTQEPPQESISQSLKSDARQSFADANTNGAIFNQNVSSQLPSDIDADLATTGKMNARLHGDTISVLNDFKDDAQNGPLTLEDLHQQRQLLGQVVNNNLHPNGAFKPDAMKADQAIDSIDNFIEQAKQNPQQYLQNSSPEALQSFQNGLDLWSKSARAADIERIMQRADLTQQPATALQTGFRTLAGSKRFGTYEPEQQDLIRTAAQVSLPAEVLRSLGSRLIGVIMAGSGNVVGGAVAEGASAIPRNLATQMQLNRAQDVLDSIAKPNPLMQPPVDNSKMLGMTQGIAPTIQYGGQ